MGYLVGLYGKTGRKLITRMFFCFRVRQCCFCFEGHRRISRFLWETIFEIELIRYWELVLLIWMGLCELGTMGITMRMMGHHHHHHRVWKCLRNLKRRWRSCIQSFWLRFRRVELQWGISSNGWRSGRKRRRRGFKWSWKRRTTSLGFRRKSFRN